MKNKKKILLVLLFLVCILSISTISAVENTTNKEVSSADNNKENNLETNIQYNDVSNSKENVELKEEENNNDEVSESKTDKTTANNAELTFTDLNTTINGNNNSTIYLSNNYKYNNATDFGLTEGIVIKKDLTIYGNGVTIDGNNLTRLFLIWNNKKVDFYNLNLINANTTQNGGAIECYSMSIVTAHYCTFINNKANRGAGIDYGNAYNCTFINNKAWRGGAIFRGDAYNCTFRGNTATENVSGAMYERMAVLCTFNGDTVYNINLMPAIINVSNYTSTYQSGEKLKFNLTANGTTLNGINTTIKIYKGSSLVKTVYALTGEGWAVNLDPGNYTAVLSLTDYPEENSVNATINVGKGNTYVVISPIDAKIGKEVTINYTTNSNGTVTIKVNGTPITDRKFTPTKEGIYNITIEIAENDHYTAATNKTTFTATKTNTTIIIRSIPNVKVGEEVTINYTINSNGTVTIKVNGTPITDGKFTPTKEGIYNITIEVEENDYYTAGYNETTFKAEKTNTTVVINPIADVLVGEEVTINYTINSNGTVTIKVNGTPITDGKFTPTKEGIYNITIEVEENDYYTAGYNETTFKAEKTNTTVEISPIPTVFAGDEVVINYTTNSNGTVTIKVNGEIIPDGKFTPPANGTYNVTIEVAENDYYTQATNETTFKAKKVASTIIAKSITTYYDLDKYLVITLNDANGEPIIGEVLTVKILGKSKNYATDDNGQINIKVPTSAPKTYQVRIKYAGSGKYKVSTTSANVTVKKATPKITAKSARFKIKTLAKKYTITIKNKNKVAKNKKVTLKVKGKTYTTKTNNKGKATFTIRNLNKKGTYNAVITVIGNYYYNQVSKKVKINVKP